MSVISVWVLPNARQQPEEEEEAVALSERRQEGKDAVYLQRHDQTASTAHFVGQTSPQERPQHHAHEDDQTCTERGRQSQCSR